MTIEGMLLFCATLALAVGKPQDVFFPDDMEGPTNNIPTRPISGSTNNISTQPTPATAVNVTTPATTDTTRVTRIPPRDPGNRIVYLVSCPCEFTYQYSPVCGTDGQTYGNMGVLECAQKCGKQVEVYLVGACGSNNG